jgi:hypothetical protein
MKYINRHEVNTMKFLRAVDELMSLGLYDGYGKHRELRHPRRKWKQIQSEHKHNRHSNTDTRYMRYR